MPVTTEVERALRDAIAQLDAVAATLDDIYAAQAKLTVAILRNAVDSLVADANPRTVSDVDFALNDVAALAGDLPPAEGDRVEKSVTAIRDALASVKSETALPDTVLQLINLLREKLSARRTAIDRATFRDPSTSDESLPHDPATLHDEASALRDSLQRAGFDTPMLSQLIATPATFYRAEVSQLIDELDVISGE